MNEKLIVLTLGLFLFLSPNIISGQERSNKESSDKKCTLCAEENNYAKDNKNVYYNGERIFGADADTFENLGDGYARDKSNAYYQGQKLFGAKGSLFKYLGKGYATDSKNTFYQGTKISGVDSSSFKVLEVGDK